MYDIVLNGKSQCLPVLIECDDLVVRVIFPQGFGNRAADQPESDKSDFGRSHDKLYSFHK